jgi:hypothetical protein
LTSALGWSARNVPTAMRENLHAILVAVARAGAASCAFTPLLRGNRRRAPAIVKTENFRLLTLLLDIVLLLLPGACPAKISRIISVRFLKA